MNWKRVEINIQNIQASSEKSTLINCPHKSSYDGYSFWHPSKLIRRGRHSYVVNLSFNDEFVFHLKKYGQGKWNRHTVIREIDITAAEFEKIYKPERKSEDCSEDYT